MSCGNIRFGANNFVEDSVITTAPASSNDADYLKSYHPSQQSIFEVDEAPIVITGLLDEPVTAEYFALIGSSLPTTATIKLELFETDVSETDLLQMDEVIVGEIKPLGEWPSGVDAWGVSHTAQGENPLMLWFDNEVEFRRWELTVYHGYEEPETPEYNDIPTQDEFGVISLEAEDAVVTALGTRTWAVTADATASGGQCLYKTGGGFYTTAGEGPRFSYVFAATQTGTHKVWVRAKSIAPTGNDSFHVSIDGAASTYESLTVDGDWHWVHAATASLSGDHTLVISAREDYVYIDKIVILPNADPSPTGTGPAASEFGEIGVELTTVRLGYLRIGSTWQPDNNYAWGYSYRMMTAAKTAMAANGKLVLLSPKKEVKRLTLPFDAMTDADAFTFARMDKERAGRPLYVAAHPDHSGWLEDDLAFIGAITAEGEFTHIFNNRHSRTLVIDEV